MKLEKIYKLDIKAFFLLILKVESLYDNLPAGVVFFDPEQKVFVKEYQMKKAIDEYFSYNPYTYTKQKVDFGTKS